MKASGWSKLHRHRRCLTFWFIEPTDESWSLRKASFLSFNLFDSLYWRPPCRLFFYRTYLVGISRRVYYCPALIERPWVCVRWSQPREACLWNGPGKVTTFLEMLSAHRRKPLLCRPNQLFNIYLLFMWLWAKIWSKMIYFCILQ